MVSWHSIHLRDIPAEGVVPYVLPVLSPFKIYLRECKQRIAVIQNDIHRHNYRETWAVCMRILKSPPEGLEALINTEEERVEYDEFLREMAFTRRELCRIANNISVMKTIPTYGLFYKRISDSVILLPDDPYPRRRHILSVFKTAGAGAGAH
jgi:hypothetical protein